MTGSGIETFGALLRHFRLLAAVSQQTLAERARLGVNTIAALERGRHTAPRPETVALLAQALQLDSADCATLIEAGSRARTLSRPAAVDFPPLSTSSIPSRLPVPPTTLVGREHDVAAVIHLLQQNYTHRPARLLSLIGPGGVGKTRLALAVATAVQGSYTDGAIFVDLSALRDPALVAATVALALGIREVGGQPVRDLLVAHLRSRQVLLVLDNFEQIVDAAPWVGDLIAACPSLTLLVTSRTALRLQAEQQYRVPPLVIPSPTTYHRVSTDLASYPVVRLFVARAQMVAPEFMLNQDNVADVVEICRRLDGIPLAIELAAARVNVLSPQALLTRLERRLPLLTGGPRDLPIRQQTLQATIEWSYTLLTSPEQALFRRLSVFAGGFSLEAAAAVYTGEGDADELLDRLAVLVDHNLLHSDNGSDYVTSVGTEVALNSPRFVMLETIREFALDCLETSGEGTPVRRAQALYCLKLAETAEPDLYGSVKEAWLACLEREHGNMRVALEWTLASGSVEIGLRLGAALRTFWQIHGYLSEGQSWLQRLLAADTATNVASADVRADVLTGAGWLAHVKGEYQRAAPLFEESSILRQARGLPDNLTDVLINSALLERARGDYRRARALLEDSLRRHRAQGQRQTIARAGLGLSLFKLGLLTREVGDFAQAEALNEECLALHQEQGDREGIAVSLLALGDIARDQGDAENVRTYCTKSLALFKDLGGVWGMGFSLNNLALAAYLQGDLAGAQSLASNSMALFQSLGSKPSIAEALITAALIVHAQGNLAQAQALLIESLTLSSVTGPRALVAVNLEELATLAAEVGQMQRAAQLCGAATHLRTILGAPLAPYRRTGFEETCATARATLGDDSFASSWAAGVGLPLERVIGEASRSLPI